MQNVAGKDDFIAAVTKCVGEMSGRVARRRDRDQILQLRRRVDETCSPACITGMTLSAITPAYISGPMLRALLALEQFIVELRHVVGGVRKSRHPTAIDQPRIPADMVGMQMRMQNVRDLLGLARQRLRASRSPAC